MRSWKRAELIFLAALVALAVSIMSASSAPDPQALKVQGPDTLGNPMFVASVPPGGTGTTQTAITSSANTANSSNVATLPGVAAKTTYITGFACTGSGATAALVVNVAVAGTVSGTLNYTFTFPAGAASVATPLVVNFTTPIPASAVNTAITVTLPAAGAGNTNAAVSAYGFQM